MEQQFRTRDIGPEASNQLWKGKRYCLKIFADIDVLI
jgi:hypothetical protein